MWHKPCRTFHPWCLCIKTRCLFCKFIARPILWLNIIMLCVIPFYRYGHDIYECTAPCTPDIWRSLLTKDLTINKRDTMAFPWVYDTMCLLWIRGLMKVTPYLSYYFEGLAQDCSNSSASAMELLQFCAKPSICTVNLVGMCYIGSWTIEGMRRYKHFASPWYNQTFACTRPFRSRLLWLQSCCGA